MHPAGVKDIEIESAITTIQDCEDSVAAVDTKTSVLSTATGWGYEGRPQRGRGKRWQTDRAPLNPDRHYTGADGEALVMHGRSLMLVHQCGHLMTAA